MSVLSFTDPRRCARGARHDVEAALEGSDWPWSRRLSLWLDVLIMIEESSGR